MAGHPCCLCRRQRYVPVKTDLPVALFPWCYKKLVEQGEVVDFATLEELPAEAHIDKQTS